MKLFKFLFLFILLSQLIFADPEAPGELNFQYKANQTGMFNLTVSTTKYCWAYINSSVGLLETGYSRNASNLTRYFFDAPKDINVGDDYIVWGLMDFTLTNKTSGKEFSMSFTLDLRDENWSTVTSRYPNEL